MSRSGPLDIPGATPVAPEVIEAFRASVEQFVVEPLVKDLPKQQALLDEARRWRLY